MMWKMSLQRCWDIDICDFNLFFSPLIYLLIAIRKKKAISRILIIQTAKIGDLICSTPVFREVKRNILMRILLQ